MSATLLYRIAAVLLILFAAAHTFGTLFAPAPTPEAAGIRDNMNKTFAVDGKSYSYGNFYKGLAICITVYLLLMASLAWYLAGMAARHPEAIGALGWAFCASKIATTIVAWIYIAPAPAITSALVALVLGLAAWRTQAAKAGAVSLAAATSLS
jgi:hypothetical protein